MESTVGGHIAVALAAGRVVTKKETVPPAIQERYEALKRAITKKSASIELKSIEAEPTSEDHRKELAKGLDEHGASKNKNVVTTASELLGLIKVDEAARDAIGDLIEAVETAATKLAEVELDEEEAPKETKDAKAEQVQRAATTSRRLLPPDEPSKTELERMELPFWQRTDNYFMKMGILVGGLLVIAIVGWLMVRTPPDESLERCRGGDAARCWQIVALQDGVEESKKKSTVEPLQVLCAQHQDPCACAGLVYVKVAETDTPVDCNELTALSKFDPKWPCTCKKYDYWRSGQARTSHCGIPRCE